MNFDLHLFIFGVYPYLALTIFFLGSWIRFDREQYTWKTDSSQLLEKQNLRMGSILFHIGIIGIFFGHLAGLVVPHSVFLALGISDLAHQWLAIIAGSLLGVILLVGGFILWRRRLFNSRVRAASRSTDIFILTWLIGTAIVGLLTVPFSVNHAVKGDATIMLNLAEWVQSILLFQPNPELIRDVDAAYKLHIFLGLSVFLVFPFTRLVHIWSFPFIYLFRAYQVVRVKRG
jgi:nitrate reductase gamma subunit